jgi:hypothetical protein
MPKLAAFAVLHDAFKILVPDHEQNAMYLADLAKKEQNFTYVLYY